MYEETEPLEKYIDYGDRLVLDEFARFTALLHSKGILHHDLNATNVRVTVKDAKVTFSLIDINRMTFMSDVESIKLEERFENIARFSSLNDDYIFFVKKYLKYSYLSEQMLDLAIQRKIKHDSKTEYLGKCKYLFKKILK